MGEHKNWKILYILSIALLVTATAGQAFIGADRESFGWIGEPIDGSLAVWEDDFLDESGIEIAMSYNYVIDINQGIVFMRDTYDVWTDPEFTRMKPIEISNTGVDTLYDYVLDLTVYYDLDMQPDFDDLRFVDEQGINLYYWIGERIENESANVLVLVPEIPAGQNITIYMFYGNPSAEDESNFDMIFTWQDRTDPDVMISFKAVEEGAWDPDVEYGGGRFLVAWEERIGPEDLPLDMERTLPSVIHGRTYNSDGGDPYPTGNDDIDISDPGSSSYHAENPSIAFSEDSEKFFVVWEQNPAEIIDDRYKSDIMGALVNVNGDVEDPFIIDAYASGQFGHFDPHVTYDRQSNRFFVVWEDATQGVDDYNIYGKMYDPYGTPIGSRRDVATDPHCQCEPWVYSDNQGHFIVVYEDGDDPVIGPFSLYAKRFDFNGNPVGSEITIAEGEPDTDYIFPAVSYNTQTDRYFVTWNDGDISVDPDDRDNYDGNIWGKILDNDGTTVTDNFIVQPGERYIRTDVVPYFNTMFFVSYDGTVGDHRDIWGRLLSSDGDILTDELMISDGSSLNIDWNNLAVGEGRIFATWEDERDVMSDYADAFGNVWAINQSAGSPDISYEFGYERELITVAVLTSTVIDPGEEFVEWHEFDALYSTPIGHIQFDIINEEGTEVIMEGIDPKEDISNITELTFRLRSTFTRTVPSDTPVLDKWNVSWYMWNDTEPPWTEIEFDPQDPNGENGWYITPITFYLTAHDNDTAPENITTYYKINGGETEIYDPENPPVISSERPDNWVEFWSVDSAENEELPHNIVEEIKIDASDPSVNILKPSELVGPGKVKINGTVIEYTSGSGVERLIIKINDEDVFDSIVEGHTVWFEWNFTAELGEAYDLHIIAYDYAGNEGHDRRQITVSDKGIYEAGYIYVFENPKIGPRPVLASLDFAVAIDHDNLYVLLDNMLDDNASSVEFVAKQRFLGREFTCFDTNLSDGCFCDFDIPIGLYEIKAYVYDEEEKEIANHLLVSKLLVILL